MFMVHIMYFLLPCDNENGLHHKIRNSPNPNTISNATEIPGK